MNLVVAIIKPFKLMEVRESLIEAGFMGLTITEVKGYCRQKGHTELYRGSEYTVETLPKIKIEILVDDDDVSKVTSTIAKSASTEKIGDGKLKERKYWSRASVFCCIFLSTLEKRV